MYNLLKKLLAQQPTPKAVKPQTFCWPLLKTSDCGIQWLVPGVWGGDYVHWWTVRMTRRAEDWICQRSEN
jgi:hypothetical protein